MNIVPVMNKKPEVWLKCKQCGAKNRSTLMYADLDGKPFEDYYCKQCTQELTLKKEQNA